MLATTGHHRRCITIPKRLRAIRWWSASRDSSRRSSASC